MDAALQTFIDEGDELLIEMEAALLACERNEWTSDTINSIFRAAHTIKGSAGLFGLEAVVAFVHVVETALDRVRLGQVPMDPAFAILLMKCSDHVKALLKDVSIGRDGASAELDRHGFELIERLQQVAGSVQKRNSSTMLRAAPSIVQAERGSCAQTKHWHISVRFKADVLRNGMDPLSFLRYLASFGEFHGKVLVSEALPALPTIDAEACYIGYELNFASDADRERIEGAFEFVREDCVLAIVAPQAPLAAYLDAIDAVSGKLLPNYEWLVRCGTLIAEEVTLALLERGAVMPLTENASSKAAAALKDDDPRKRERREVTAAESRSIRVDAQKLDQLITLLGELTIAAAGASLSARRVRHVELQESTSRMADLVEEVRDAALQLRMVKIGPTFNRFQRVISDMARELGKQIQLVVTGEDTELDKTVVEKIADPLTHLVRNSIDHGICTPDVRESRGKPAIGTIKLNAYHDSGSIVIEVSDDGNGLKRDKILAKAIQCGLVAAGDTLSDSEVYALIFEPGFSTADQVTNLSGRGVGMDVVKRNIEALRGTINVRSKEGVGTVTTIRLPLTLAIINGFQVAVGKSVFVIPLEMVEECIDYSSESGHDYANVRGEALPFIRLHELFNLKRSATLRQNIVIVKHAGVKAGLVVDHLLGECQTVIKPLSKMFDQVRCISGSSILGNGEVALILDVPLLVQQALDGNDAAAPANTTEV